MKKDKLLKKRKWKKRKEVRSCIQRLIILNWHDLVLFSSIINLITIRLWCRFSDKNRWSKQQPKMKKTLIFYLMSFMHFIDSDLVLFLFLFVKFNRIRDVSNALHSCLFLLFYFEFGPWFESIQSITWSNKARKCDFVGFSSVSHHFIYVCLLFFFSLDAIQLKKMKRTIETRISKWTFNVNRLVEMLRMIYDLVSILAYQMHFRTKFGVFSSNWMHIWRINSLGKKESFDPMKVHFIKIDSMEFDSIE